MPRPGIEYRPRVSFSKPRSAPRRRLTYHVLRSPSKLRTFEFVEVGHVTEIWHGGKGPGASERFHSAAPNVSDAEALPEVAGFLFATQDPIYASDVAEALGLPLDQVERILDSFGERGLISRE